MKLVVFLEVGADLRIPPERDPRSGRVRQEWLVRELDAASRQALHVALRLKKVQPETEITVIHLGGVEDESWLRHALAQGSDRAVRVWDGEMSGVSAAGKAVVLSAAAQAAGYDLILTGARGAIDEAGQLGVLLGERFGCSLCDTSRGHPPKRQAE
jgi:electron transfer flavoprotein alpha/beta subunit